MTNKKRIMTELYSHISGKYNDIIKSPNNCFYNKNNGEDDCDFYNLYDDDSFVNIKIIFKSIMYPFAPPNIKINNMSLDTFLKINYKFIDYYRKYLNIHLKCFCVCCSIPILSNWSPSYTITDILNSINDQIILKKRVINMILIKNIMLKKIGYIIPNMFYFI